MHGLRNERAMLSPIHLWLASLGFFTKNEFQMPWGICDLVGVKADPTAVIERVKEGRIPVATLLAIPTRGSRRYTTIEELASTLGPHLEAGQISDIVKRLKSKKFVSVNDGRITRPSGRHGFYEKIVAVEFKLTRIEEALAQATHHKVVTSDSYVALPHIVAEKAVHDGWRAEFGRKGVGLISLRSDACDVVWQPARSSIYPVNPVFECHAAERFWPEISKAVQH
jgi:hypothetical protein